MKFLYTVVNATIENYDKLANFADDERFVGVDLLDIVTALEKPFNKSIISYDSNIIVEIHKVITEKGICYAFNSPLSIILTGK